MHRNGVQFVVVVVVFFSLLIGIAYYETQPWNFNFDDALMVWTETINAI